MLDASRLKPGFAGVYPCGRKVAMSVWWSDRSKEHHDETLSPIHRCPRTCQPVHSSARRNPAWHACPCCEGHARYLERNGIDVDVRPLADIAAISKGVGVPADYQGCHTLMLGGYAIEGHVTVEIIHKQLNEHPADVVGISLHRDAHRGSWHDRAVRRPVQGFRHQEGWKRERLPTQ